MLEGFIKAYMVFSMIAVVILLVILAGYGAYWVIYSGVLEVMFS